MQEVVIRLRSLRDDENSIIFSKTLQIKEPELLTIVKEDQQMSMLRRLVSGDSSDDEGWKTVIWTAQRGLLSYMQEPLQLQS